MHPVQILAVALVMATAAQAQPAGMDMSAQPPSDLSGTAAWIEARLMGQRNHDGPYIYTITDVKAGCDVIAITDDVKDIRQFEEPSVENIPSGNASAGNAPPGDSPAAVSSPGDASTGTAAAESQPRVAKSIPIKEHWTIPLSSAAAQADATGLGDFELSCAQSDCVSLKTAGGISMLGGYDTQLNPPTLASRMKDAVDQLKTLCRAHPG